MEVLDRDGVKAQSCDQNHQDNKSTDSIAEWNEALIGGKTRGALHSCALKSIHVCEHQAPGQMFHTMLDVPPPQNAAGLQSLSLDHAGAPLAPLHKSSHRNTTRSEEGHTGYRPCPGCVAVPVQEQLYPFPTVPGQRKCTVIGDGAERSHWSHKLDFGAWTRFFFRHSQSFTACSGVSDLSKRCKVPPDWSCAKASLVLHSLITRRRDVHFNQRSARSNRSDTMETAASEGCSNTGCASVSLFDARFGV